MISGSYRFKVGDFECVSLSDGAHDYPLQSFFSNVPKEQIEAILSQRNLPTDLITTPYTYLYVNTGDHQVLVDMGMGHPPQTGKMVQIPSLGYVLKEGAGWKWQPIDPAG